MITYYGSLKTYFNLKLNLYFEFKIEIYNPKYLSKLKKAFDLVDAIDSPESFDLAEKAFKELPHSDCPDETRLSMIIKLKRRSSV